jgi:hypothetical protein
MFKNFKAGENNFNENNLCLSVNTSAKGVQEHASPDRSFLYYQIIGYRPSLELSEMMSVVLPSNALAENTFIDGNVISYDYFAWNYDDLHNLGSEWWTFPTAESIHQSVPQIKESFEENEQNSILCMPLMIEHSSDGVQKEPASKRIGCRCNMSKCLRLHCRCFKDQEYCAKNCKCTNCFNNEEHLEARNFVIAKTKEINQNAFSSKIVVVENEFKSKVNVEGCFCKKGCNRNYCDCFKNGVGCSSLCKCKGCLNAQLDFKVNRVKKYSQLTKNIKGTRLWAESANTLADDNNNTTAKSPNVVSHYKLSFPTVMESFELYSKNDRLLDKRSRKQSNCLPSPPVQKRIRLDTLPM